MTSIAGLGQIVSSATQSALPKMAVGQRMEATVLGPARQGVVVMIGQEKFQLDVPSRLASAEMLILEGTSSSSANSQRVRIIASDDGPLARPVPADLRSRPESMPSAAGAILEKGLVKVAAQPLAADGKALGPDVTLHLKTASPELAEKAMAERPVVVGTGVTTSTAVIQNNSPGLPDRRTGPDLPRQPQSEIRDAPVGVERVRDRGSPAMPSQTAVKPQRTSAESGAPGRDAAILASPPASNVPNVPSPGATKARGGDPSVTGTPPEGNRRGLSAMPEEGMASPSIKTMAASAVSAYRNEAELSIVRVSKAPLENAGLIEPRSDVDRSRPIPATVVDRTEAGKVILKAEGRHYRIEQPIDLPPGTSLQVMLAASSMPATGGAGDRGGVKDSGVLLTKLIEILDDIDLAGRQTAETEQPNRTRQLPLPNRQLASKFLGLLNADHGAPLQGGRTSSAPEQAGLIMDRRNQIQTLVRELGTMASEPLAEGWKSLTLPLGPDPAQAASFFFREQVFDPDDEAADGEAEQSETQRAVFDISFSRLGRCQIDTLCQERRFDLLIRNERSLNEEDRQEIVSLFSSACEISGMTGEVGFKVGGFFEPVRSSLAGRDLRT